MVLSTPASLAFHASHVPFAAADRSYPAQQINAFLFRAEYAYAPTLPAPPPTTPFNSTHPSSLLPTLTTSHAALRFSVAGGGVSGGAGGGGGRPCGIEHAPSSRFATVEVDRSEVVEAMDAGARVGWTGTCDPREAMETGTKPACRVDVLFKGFFLDLHISGCAGLDGFTTARWGLAPTMAEAVNGSEIQYKDIDIFYTSSSARSGGATNALAVARATWAWTLGTTSSVTFNVRRTVVPGNAAYLVYPSQSPGVGVRTFPCQVLNLQRVAASHYSLSRGSSVLNLQRVTASHFSLATPRVSKLMARAAPLNRAFLDC
ncbi:hypothetical protein T484DRAFT_1788503, partial [Baffinella frigidus]